MLSRVAVNDKYTFSPEVGAWSGCPSRDYTWCHTPSATRFLETAIVHDYFKFLSFIQFILFLKLSYMSVYVAMLGSIFLRRMLPFGKTILCQESERCPIVTNNDLLWKAYGLV